MRFALLFIISFAYGCSSGSDLFFPFHPGNSWHYGVAQNISCPDQQPWCSTLSSFGGDVTVTVTNLDPSGDVATLSAAYAFTDRSFTRTVMVRRTAPSRLEVSHDMGATWQWLFDPAGNPTGDVGTILGGDTIQKPTTLMITPGPQSTPAGSFPDAVLLWGWNNSISLKAGWDPKIGLIGDFDAFTSIFGYVDVFVLRDYHLQTP